MDKGVPSGLSEAQKALFEAGLPTDVIRYPAEVNTFGMIRVLMQENEALIDAVRELTRQKKLLLYYVPQTCSTCARWREYGESPECEMRDVLNETQEVDMERKI